MADFRLILATGAGMADVDDLDAVPGLNEYPKAISKALSAKDAVKHFSVSFLGCNVQFI